MNLQNHSANLPEQSGSNSHPTRDTGLSEEDQRALALMLNEDPRPLRDLNVGERFDHRERTYTVLARAPRRVAVLGTCAKCGFPFVQCGSPGPLLKHLATRCDLHRSHPKKRPGRRARAPTNVMHEIPERQQFPGKITPGDFLVRGGHGYLVAGLLDKRSDRTGQNYEIVQLIALCAECGTPFQTTQIPRRMHENYQVRRCPKHRRLSKAPPPWRWTRELARQAWERF